MTPPTIALKPMDKAYFDANQDLIEEAVTRAVDTLFASRPADPLAFLAAQIANKSDMSEREKSKEVEKLYAK